SYRGPERSSWRGQNEGKRLSRSSPNHHVYTFGGFMPCTQLDPATTIAMPWKNGGGTTLQLAISPKGASLEDFAWRISSAQVAVDGAFSSFPGADRSLAV